MIDVEAGMADDRVATVVTEVAAEQKIKDQEEKNRKIVEQKEEELRQLKEREVPAERGKVAAAAHLQI